MRQKIGTLVFDVRVFLPIRMELIDRRYRLRYKLRVLSRMPKRIKEYWTAYTMSQNSYQFGEPLSRASWQHRWSGFFYVQPNRPQPLLRIDITGNIIRVWMPGEPYRGIRCGEFPQRCRIILRVRLQRGHYIRCMNRWFPCVADIRSFNANTFSR